MLKSIPYRAAIGYSKVVDPATAAREGEVVSAQKYAILMGATISNDVTLAAIDSMLAELERREAANNEIRAQQGLPPLSIKDVKDVRPRGEVAPSDTPADSPTISTLEELLALKPGSEFIWGPTGERGFRRGLPSSGQR